MSRSANSLPALPGMLVRAIPTMVRRGRLGAELTEITARYRCGAVTSEQLTAYHQQFPDLLSDVPLTFFYLIAQRAHLAIMLQGEFPWSILGMVHVANRMEMLGHIDQQQGFELDVRIDLPPRATTRKRIRPLYTVDFVQQGRVVVRCESTYQVGGSSGKPARARRSTTPELVLDEWSELNHWDLHAGLGRSYARLSGDYNPIHLHPWLSRWFGFEQPIIHGMYSVARIQSDIEQRTGKTVRYLEVTFRRPLILPNTAKSFILPTGQQLLVTDGTATKAFLDGSYALANEPTVTATN